MSRNSTRIPPNSFKITIPNDKGRSELTLTVHYNREYPSECYPKFTVYADWLSDDQIAKIEETLVFALSGAFDFRWKCLPRTRVRLLFTIGWNGFVRMFNPKRCKKSRTGFFLSTSDVSEVSPEPKLSPRANSEKSKPSSHPDPLPVKEFCSGVSEHGFVRPPNCVSGIRCGSIK